MVQLNDDDLVFDPENLPVESDMYQDLIETNEMNFLGMDLSKTALDVVGENFLGHSLPRLDRRRPRLKPCATKADPRPQHWRRSTLSRK